MATYNFTATYSNGLYVDNVNYLTARAAANGVEAGSLHTGQYYYSPNYRIYRGFLWFDTSLLDSNCLIKSAYLTLVVDDDRAYSPFEIIIQKGNGAPHNPIEVGDYNKDSYSGNGGSVNTIDSKTVINLNYTGLSWINKTGNTILVLRSGEDINASEPTGLEYIQWYNYNSIVQYRPKLTVEYFTPTGIPTVGDPTFSNTKATYTKATANVSDTGGGYEERGFEYGISEEATWAVRETGTWGTTGNYSLVLPNLLPLTTYYARAYVTNSYGTAYSDWTSFTTTDVPSYGLYEEDNTATICFYLSEDDGKTWGQKHGPYTTDQANIEITKLLVRGSGKKKIKFESDVLTGISASVMVKLDLKAR